MKMTNVYKKSTSIWSLYVIVILVILIGFFIVQVGPETPYRFENDEIGLLNQDWTYERDGKQYDLPIILSGPYNEPFSISKVMGQEFQNEQFICVRGSLQRVRVLIDGAPIYDNIQKQQGFLHSPKLSIWNMVKIPEGNIGKKLTIEYTTDIASLTGRFGGVYYGSESEIVNYLVRKYGNDLPFVLVIFSIGVIMFLIPALLKHYKQLELIYLGLFAIAISLWFFSESLLLQFVTGNSWILGGSGCVLQSIAPIPLILYIRLVVVKETKKYFAIMASVMAANSILIVTLQLFGIMSLFESLKFTHTIFAIASLLLILCFIKEIVQGKNIRATRFIKALLPFLFFVGIEILGFYFESFHKSTHFTKIGLIIFLLIQSVDTINQMVALIKKSYQAEVHEQLAFHDRLTGSPNRLAFEKAMEQHFNPRIPAAKWRLVMFDLDKLKMINDEHGHIAGDSALISGYHCIINAFGKNGNCYRIGGDEFACILTDPDETDYAEKLSRLNQLLKNEDEKRPYVFGISVGCAVVDYQIDQDYKDLMHRADLKMYENKYRSGVVVD